MSRKTKLNLNNKQKEWLSELITCEQYNIIKLSKSDRDIIIQTIYAGWYYDYERVLLNSYLSEYPLPRLRKLLMQRK
jgi:hypothetical protein